LKLHELAPAPGARKKPKRIGLGLGSGHGKTACKGTKGHKARAGGGVRPGFEGGQMPLVRRIPKRGFSNARHSVRIQAVNVSSLEAKFEAGAEVSVLSLFQAGLISDAALPVKILGDGDLTKSLIVRAHAFSGGAKGKIEAVGGKAEVV
jgi:large subunit ribosomal protein L15